MPFELGEAHAAKLRALVERGFEPFALPFFPNHIGIKKGSCAALLEPTASGFKPLAAGAWLIEGNLSVRVERRGRQRFVWKSHEVEATPDRLAELDHFDEELTQLLSSP